MSADSPQTQMPPLNKLNNPHDVELPSAVDSPSSPSITTSKLPHRRMRTNTAEIDSTISHPGSVKINVKGAFIVDHDSVSPNRSVVNGGSHDSKDIRLPNHTAVVSHIAVDVSSLILFNISLFSNFEELC
jgi:hypothetical protein